MVKYGSGSVVDVDVDKLALYMDMQGTMYLKFKHIHRCMFTHASVHTMFRDGNIW